MALTIASGFVVYVAIVMIENIVRYIEAGEKPLAAAYKGAAQGNWFHNHIFDRFTHRRFHPAIIYERHRRPLIPRICAHTYYRSFGFSCNFTYANANDVRPHFATG